MVLLYLSMQVHEAEQSDYFYVLTFGQINITYKTRDGSYKKKSCICTHAHKISIMHRQYKMSVMRCAMIHDDD